MKQYMPKWLFVLLAVLFCTVQVYAQGNPGLNDVAYDMDVSVDGKVYVTGLFSEAGGVEAAGVAMWDGEKWNGLGGGLQEENIPGNNPGRGAAIRVDGSDVYVAGEFRNVGEEKLLARYIAKWDGTQWNALGSGEQVEIAGIESMAVYQGKLYIAGTFAIFNRNEELIWYLAAWDGSQWNTVPGASTLGAGAKIDVIGGRLIAIDAGGFPRYFNGTSWPPLVTGGSSAYSIAFQSLLSSVYIGGPFVEVTLTDPEFKWIEIRTPAAAVARWDPVGEEWHSLGTGIGDDPPGIWVVPPDGASPSVGEAQSMTFHNGALVVAGRFDRAGTINNVNNTAIWTGNSWRKMGDGFERTESSGPLQVRRLVSTKRLLYACGWFEKAGGQLLDISRNGMERTGGPLGPVEGDALFVVDNEGNASAAGEFQTTGADFAESWPIKEAGENQPGPGDVLALGQDGEAVCAAFPGQNAVIGVCVEQPGLAAGVPTAAGKHAESRVWAAMRGVVNVRVDSTQAPIQPGDLLTLADTPGHLKRAKPVTIAGRTFYAEEQIVGRALEGLSSGQGTIRILLTQHYK